MKQCRKIMAGLMALVLMTGVCTLLVQSTDVDETLIVSAEEEEEGTEGTYGALTYVNYGEYIEITDFDNTAEEVEIPSEIEGIPVTGIASFAFQISSSLTSVTIPDSVTSIGYWAFFQCSNLVSVAIPESVTSIGGQAFVGTAWIKQKFEENELVIVNDIVIAADYEFAGNIIIPDDVIEIGDYAFSECDITSVTIPDSVTRIGSWAFSYCENLTTVNIPEGITVIERNTFLNCPNLTTITIPESVTSIGDSAFHGCTSLTDIKVSENNTKYSSNDGVLMNKDGTELIIFPSGRTKYTIPDSVISIANGAFEYCESLTSITIPDSVTNIGENTFSSCTSLTSVTIPDSVISIANGAFEYCESLTSIAISDSVTSIGEWAFYDCTSLTDVYYFGTEDQWNEIEIDDGNEELTYATVHFNSTADDIPTTEETQPSDTTVTLWGDVDNSGDLSIVDVIILNKNLMLGEPLSEQGAINADVDQNGSINATDSLNILKAVVKIIELPIK